MTIQHLKYISAVEHYGSITKAAQKLYGFYPRYPVADAGYAKKRIS